jgi:hypothetical protein
MLWPSLAGAPNMSQGILRDRVAQLRHATLSPREATGLNTISTSMRGRG